MNLRRVLAVMILGSVLVLTFVLGRHLLQQEPEKIIDVLPKQVDLALDQLHYTQNENGERSWTLNADSAEYRRAADEALLENVHLILYRAGRFGEVRLAAEHGRLLQEQQQVEVWDRVVIRTTTGEQLWTERLIFDGRQQRLKTAAPVRLLTPQLELTGKGLEVNLTDGRLLLQEDVRGKLFPVQKERTTHD